MKIQRIPDNENSTYLRNKSRIDFKPAIYVAGFFYEIKKRKREVGKQVFL